MVNKELINYIKTEEAQGYTSQQLRNYLIQQGYNAQEVDEAINYANKKNIYPKQQNTVLPKYKKKWMIGAILLLVMLVFGIFFFLVILRGNLDLMLFSDVAVTEFQVNTYTQDNQKNSFVAIDNVGNFVIVWDSFGQDGNGTGVFAQRYDDDGNKIGPEFQVNTYTQDYQHSPFVAMDTAGNFLIAWESNDDNHHGNFAQTYDSKGNKIGEEFEVAIMDDVAMDAVGNFAVAGGFTQSVGYESSGVFAQRYDNQGNVINQDFLVNTHTQDSQYYPSVATDAAGNFVMTWVSEEQDGSEQGIFAQRFDNNGNKSGDEFQVNTYNEGGQWNPLVAMDEIGNFVIVWESMDQDGDGDGIYGQRFDSNGDKLGQEFQVNTYTQGDQFKSSVAMDAAGNFLIVWQSWEQGYGIFAQRYDSNGNKLGPNFQVNNEEISYALGSPSMAMGSSGDFVIAWDGHRQGGSEAEIFVKRFDSNGNNLGDEFQVNTETINNQWNPSVTMDDAGNFVIAWTSEGKHLRHGIFAQRFDSDGNMVGKEFQVKTNTELNQDSQSVAMDSAGNFVIIWENYDQIIYRYVAQRYDSNGNKLGGELSIGESAGRPGSSVAMDKAGNILVVWGGNTQKPQYEDGVFVQRYDSQGNEIGQDFLVNTYTEEKQENPFMAMDSAGNFVVAWQSWEQDGDGEGIYAQRFDSNGNKIGQEFQVNTYTKGRQSNPLVVMNDAGDFLIAWYEWGNNWEKDGRNSGIFAQLFDSNGNKLGQEFQVKAYTEEDIKSDSIIGVSIASYDMDMDAAGNFVIAWEMMELGVEEDIVGIPVNSEIFAQRYDSKGNKVGQEFQVNKYTKSFQSSPSVAMDDAGNFVIAWESRGQDGSDYGVYAGQYKLQ